MSAPISETTTTSSSLTGQLMQLGRRKHEYLPSQANALTFLIFGAVCLLLAVSALVFVITSGGFSDLTLSGNLAPLLLTLIVVVVLLVVGGFCVYVYFIPRTSVAQYENGLAIYRGGQLTAVVPWESVTEFYQDVTRYRAYGVNTATVYTYRITTRDGRSFSFGANLRKIDKLGERIQEAVIPIIAARAQAAFNAGQPAQFGAVTLSQAGLTYKGNSIPWTEFSGVRVSNGHIELQKQGRWFNWASLAIADTPNALALVYLLNQLLATRPRS